jgi:ATP-dependent 26S proteasome regulatory subunit
MSEGMSGAEITLICREAGLMALTEDSNIEKASMEDIVVKDSHFRKSLA